MKKITIISVLGLLLIFLINCSPKIAKTTASSKVEDKESKIETTESKIEEKTEAAATAFSDEPLDRKMEIATSLDVARVEHGKTIFESNCGKCHELYNPSSRNSEQWLKILKSMSKKAKLDETEYTYVSGYLVQNAKK